ncbi:hypothetical protein MCOR27_010555 [Pyricularia oryzae]|uniref:Uncharacterized protein n=2 Tax=Pyricularia TaxID=48558 RepID=A0ABQ8N2P0_PYRGI|nr:hypothetical protein MCOR02_010870 [Pyricularia oryzae]KAI6290203.1 hypothetical protein MCOR33_011441 [Pyricularia grisea]KAI6252954.1 hypothetical protein MCOR19_010464 [Pyricularia oryzae]KAI6267514.1 hypothetical protein MCOR27_010555 [Pyricularia oryzae]KAI6312223.1 hypothetical protein MCOR30_010643 [Pyricularia oryzae]
MLLRRCCSIWPGTGYTSQRGEICAEDRILTIWTGAKALSPAWSLNCGATVRRLIVPRLFGPPNLSTVNLKTTPFLGSHRYLDVYRKTSTVEHTHQSRKVALPVTTPDRVKPRKRLRRAEARTRPEGFPGDPSISAPRLDGSGKGMGTHGLMIRPSERTPSNKVVHTVERDCGDRNTSVDELSLEAEQPRDNLAGPCITACTAQILRHATGKKNACVYISGLFPTWPRYSTGPCAMYASSIRSSSSVNHRRQTLVDRLHKSGSQDDVLTNMGRYAGDILGEK